jgi:DNA modification methylase
MKRVKRRMVREKQRAEVELREALEVRYRRILERDDALAKLVTAEGSKDEPFHRWLSYRQGFSPALVRRFLEVARLPEGPVLDPFSGSGTVVTECALRGRAALGSDVVRSLLLTTRARFGEPPETWSDLGLDDPIEELWHLAASPAQRAAVLLAAAETVDGQGRRKQSALGDAERVARITKMMQEDLATPAERAGILLRADARRIPLQAASVAGVLTSPPYLSRYDYEAVNRPMEALLQQPARKGQQVRAARATAKGKVARVNPVAEEAAALLAKQGDKPGAHALRGYFDDMERFLGEAFRVLMPNAPAWVVVGGADFKREYIPSDLILAEIGQRIGFTLEACILARRLRPQGRQLGGMSNVAPRETLLKLRKP